MSNQSLEPNIDLFNGGYRVRVKTLEGEIREYHRDYPAAARALTRIRKQHPPYRQNGIVRRPSSGGSHSHMGVSRCVKTDYRKPHHPQYLCFSVNWKDRDGRKRVNAFRVANVETVTPALEHYAEQTAIAFREAYEYATLNGLPFHPEAFSCWRTVQCFPFRSPADWRKTARQQSTDAPEVFGSLSAAAIQAFLAGPAR